MSATIRRVRPRPRRPLTIAALLASLAYAAAILWLITQETRLVFQAGPLGTGRPAFPYEQVDVGRGDGARQFAWSMPHADGSARAWLLYLHGNAATIASQGNLARYRELRDLGLNVFAPEYRGYGGLPGSPTEQALGEDARAAHAYLRDVVQVPEQRIVVYGWSLGSAVAVDLASDRRVGAVILEGAPASIAAIGQQQYPLFPVRLIMRNPFESIARIPRVRAPKLFLHSPEDDIIPIAEGRRLFDAAAEPKKWVEVRGGHIYANDVDASAFFGAIRAFLSELRLI